MTEPTKTTLPDGAIEYRKAEGQRHRADGPAFTRPNGYQEWYLNGQLHRADGPAITGSSGYQAWYLRGKRMTQAEHAAAIEAQADAVTQAAADERAKIVAWLRGDWSGYDTAQRAKLFAGLIEAGEHLK